MWLLPLVQTSRDPTGQLEPRAGPPLLALRCTHLCPVWVQLPSLQEARVALVGGGLTGGFKCPSYRLTQRVLQGVGQTQS